MNPVEQGAGIKKGGAAGYRIQVRVGDGNEKGGYCS
jgi:hypothetical protein